jgi:hypothetical protein
MQFPLSFSVLTSSLASESAFSEITYRLFIGARAVAQGHQAVNNGTETFNSFREVLLETGTHSGFFELTASGSAVSNLEPVPEPATLLLFGTTAAGLGYLARRRRKGNP